MKALPICALALCLCAPAFAGDDAPAPTSHPQSQPSPQSRPQPAPARDMKTLLQELRDLDSSQDMDGDHVVGEHLC